MRYTFENSNLVKIALIPVYALTSVVALLMPRDRNLWVFGRKTGVGDGPLAVLLSLKEASDSYRLVWIAQDKSDSQKAAELGIESYLRTSLKAVIVTLRAKYIVITHGLGDIARITAPGAFIIQLWHGAPLKKIYLDAPVSHKTGNKLLDAAVGPLLSFMYAITAKLPKLYIAPSELVASRYVTAFGIPLSKIQVTGDPRNDVLCRGNNPESILKAREILKSLWHINELPSHIIMYAPTWRDGRGNPNLPDYYELAAIEKLAEEFDALFVMRSHPWGVGIDELEELDSRIDRVRFLPSSLLSDVNQILSAVDILISDYSAITMDYSLLERPVIFYAPDLQEHQGSRGFYEDYNLFTGGCWVESWGRVLEEIREIMSSSDALRENIQRSSAQIKVRYQNFNDGSNTARLLDAVTRLN